MPKAANDALIWSSERGMYELFEQGRIRYVLQAEDDRWYAWLNEHSSFAFQGKHSHLTLRKELRKRGESYWYAYRNQSSRTAKKYVGRSIDLTVARLEETADFLDSVTLPASDSQQPPSLLAPKLHLPRLQSSLVPRTRLLARMDAGLEYKLTLLSAPAGFGKTTLVSQWIAAHQPLPVAWVSLDAGDNDPIRFWRYVITACQELQAGLGASSLAHLHTLHAVWHSSFGQPSLDSVLTAFLNELTFLPGRGILVLEDYHTITTSQIHETLANLIEYLPPTLHLILITRTDPPLPLARLRSHNDLIELHAGDLRFSLAETRQFLQQALAFPLSTETIQHLDERTEGWGAGLRLLTLALQEQASEQEIADFLATFTGSQHHLLEYFVSEILDAQPEPLQAFLLQTSILHRLTAALCDAVTGRNDGAQNLAYLERANLFLQSLGGTEQWYRYHALFAEAMLYEAHHRLGDEMVQACYNRASSWYEQQGLFTEAIDSALAAKDVIRAAHLIERLVDKAYFSEINELYTLRRWLEHIPQEELQHHPVLCFYYAIALSFTHDPRTPATAAELEGPLQWAEQVWRSENNTARLGEVFAFRALTAIWQREDLPQAESLSRQALAWLPETAITWRSVALGFVGAGELERGQIQAARQTILQALALCEIVGNPYMIHPVQLILGRIYQEQNELQLAGEIYRQVHDGAGEDPSDRQRALLGLAQLSYAWNRLEAAQQQAQEALDIGKQFANEARRVEPALLLARVQHAQGEIEESEHTLHSLLTSVLPSKSPLLHREILAYQARLQLADGELSSVQRWADARIPLDEPHTLLLWEREELIVARLLIAQNKAEEALDMLTRLLVAANEDGRMRSVLEILILISRAYFMLKQAQQAEQALQEALALAQPADQLCLFLDEGESIAILLQSMLPQVQERPINKYTKILLQAFTGQHVTESATSLIEPLSGQELRVLRLLAAGRSRNEIAGELVVSLNTVKTHLQHIYQKLNARNRREACETARLLRLL